MSETVDFSSLFQGSASKELQKQFIGMEFDAPPETNNLTSAFVQKNGALLSRATNASLWAWVQKTQSKLLTDTAWLTMQSESVGGRVPYFSQGDGSTTFRVPAEGTVLTSRKVVENGSDDYWQWEIYDDGTRHFWGRIILPAGEQGTGYDVARPTAVGSDTEGWTLFANVNGISSTSDKSAMTTESFMSTSVVRLKVLAYSASSGTYVWPAVDRLVYVDAWNYATDSTDFIPLGLKYIYTGSDTTQTAPVPTLEQLLSVQSLPNLAFNNWHENAFNQRSFDGDWSSLDEGEYGLDMWMKYDSTHKAFIVEAGNYIPDETYIVQADGVVLGTVKAPSDGEHWLHAFPYAMDKFDIRLGEIKVPWHPESKEQKQAECLKHYIYNTVKSRYFLTAINQYGGSLPPQYFPQMMRVVPTITYKKTLEYAGGHCAVVTTPHGGHIATLNLTGAAFKSRMGFVPVTSTASLVTGSMTQNAHIHISSASEASGQYPSGAQYIADATISLSEVTDDEAHRVVWG